MQIDRDLSVISSSQEQIQGPCQPGPTALSLQDFFGRLPGPRPFPIPRNPTAQDFNAGGFVNTLLTEARGTRLAAKYFFWEVRVSRRVCKCEIT